MDGNTTTVLLTTIIALFVVVFLRQYNSLSLHVRRLNLSLVGMLKLKIDALRITLCRHPPSMPTAFLHGSLALPGMITRPGIHDFDFDLVVLTAPDTDHRDGLMYLFECKHHHPRS